MAKKETAVTGAELIQEENIIPAEEEKELVCYCVSAPGGVYLREGPGRAYRVLAVLPVDTTVLGADVLEHLREDRKPGDSAWLDVTTPAGVGWVDGAYLERVADGPTE